MPAGRKGAKLFNFRANTEIAVRVQLDGIDLPELQLRVERSDMCYVLKVKIECALRLVQYRDSAMREAVAEDVNLEYRGVAMRDMMSIDKYGLKDGQSVVASLMPQLPERDRIVRLPEQAYLDDLINAETGVPSTGTVRRIVNRRGPQCQVWWRRRWFRAEIINVYSTSLLLGWLDWPEAEWPNFFVRFTLPSLSGEASPPSDETWRIRWHNQLEVPDLPVVVPRFSELPPMLWVKAFLRTYALADESQILRELHSRLPPELLSAGVGGASQAHDRHRVLVLGASGVGKSTLVQTFCAGPPSATLDGDGDDAATVHSSARPYWPTVGARCTEAKVSAPGLAPLPLEVWDTSGRERFKPLSLAFFRQAHSVVLVFSVKSRQSFRQLGRAGGWLSDFTRMTGRSPRNFPFILVGNSADEDLTAPREVFEDDVRAWCHAEGGMMPYIETCMVGPPSSCFRDAERVFRTVARLDNLARENFGRHRPPDTVRVDREADYEEEALQKNLVGSMLHLAKHSNFVTAATAPLDLVGSYLKDTRKGLHATAARLAPALIAPPADEDEVYDPRKAQEEEEAAAERALQLDVEDGLDPRGTWSQTLMHDVSASFHSKLHELDTLTTTIIPRPSKADHAAAEPEVAPPPATAGRER